MWPKSGRSPDHPLRDREAFGRFYERHSGDLLIFLTRRVYEPEIAMDLTAETFAEALIKRNRFRGETEEEAVAWIYAIARGLLGRFARRGRVESRALSRLGVDPPSLDDGEAALVIERSGRDDLHAAVRHGLRELSEEQRQAVELRVMQELDYPSVAARLGITEQAARARVSRALRKLSETTGMKEKVV